MKVDAHQHFWHFDPVRDRWITEEMSVLRRDYLPEELESVLAPQGIEGTVAVQADQSEEETHFLLGLAQEHPFIFGVVGWVDLLAPDLEERLGTFSGFDRFRGVRHIAQAEADHFLARGDVAHRIGLLKGFGLTYDLLVYPRQLHAALSLVARLPEQPFVLDHVAKPPIKEGRLEPWATLIKELARSPNVSCKVSGLVTEAEWERWQPLDFRPFLDVVFEAFGPDRVMWGSDWPVCLLAASYRDVWGLVEDYAEAMSPVDREKLFGGNAAEFYGLGV